MNSTVTKLTAALPTLNPSEATAALEVAVPTTVRGAARFLEELATHLSEHPDALTSGDTRCPPALIRLTHVLHDRGHHVVRPGCAHCGKAVVELRQLRPEGRVCGTCDGRSRRSTCARCGQQEVRIAARRTGRQALLPLLPTRSGDIPGMRRAAGASIGPSHAWTTEASSVNAAGNAPSVRAARVDNSSAPRASMPTAPTAMRATTSIVSHADPCGQCGKLRAIVKSATEDEPDLCGGCYRGPKMTCSRCGKLRPCKGYTKDSRFARRATARDDATPAVGAATRSRDQRPLADGAGLRPLLRRRPAITSRVRPVSNVSAADRPRRRRRRDLRSLCRFRHRLQVPQLRPGRIPLRARPMRILRPRREGSAPTHRSRRHRFRANSCPWQRPSRRPTARSNRSIGSRQARTRGCSANSSPTEARSAHDLLDELPPSRNVHYIRQMMVQTGVLPERHEDLERLPAWLDHHLLDKPTEHANLIRPVPSLVPAPASPQPSRRPPVPRLSRPRPAPPHPRRASDRPASIDEHGLTLDVYRKTTSISWLDEEKTQRRNRIRSFS